MRRLKSREYEKDCRIAGDHNGENLAIARAVTSEVLSQESPHLHETATEYYIFLRGKAELLVEDVIVPVSAGDVIVIEPGEKHKVHKVLEELDYMAIRDNPKNDKKIIEQ